MILGVNEPVVPHLVYLLYLAKRYSNASHEISAPLRLFQNAPLVVFRARRQNSDGRSFCNSASLPSILSWSTLHLLPSVVLSYWVADSDSGALQSAALYVDCHLPYGHRRVGIVSISSGFFLCDVLSGRGYFRVSCIVTLRPF